MHWQNIPISIRRNRRAKQIYLRVRPCQGVEVVLPYRVSIHEVPSILERNQDWITKRMGALRARGEGPGEGLQPEVVHLVLAGQSYRVSYAHAETSSLIETGNLLQIRFAQELHGLALLQRWLIRKGRLLVPLCREESALHRIPIGRSQVRNQQSCWGSCSRSGTISLNAKLLFLDEFLARHVIRHELCHVTHRNHGPAFRVALTYLDPLTDRQEEALNKAWKSIPAWTKWRGSPQSFAE